MKKDKCCDIGNFYASSPYGVTPFGSPAYGNGPYGSLGGPAFKWPLATNMFPSLGNMGAIGLTRDGTRSVINYKGDKIDLAINEPAFTGRALSMQRSVYTQLLLYNEELDNIVWGGSATVTSDIGDLWKIEDDSIVTQQDFTQTITKLSTNKDPFAFTLFIEKKLTSSYCPHFEIQFKTGGVTNVFGVKFDPYDGANTTITSTAEDVDFVVADYGNYWQIIMVASDSDANTDVEVQFYPARYLTYVGAADDAAVGYQLIKYPNMFNDPVAYSHASTEDVAVIVPREYFIRATLTNTFKKVFSESLGGGEGTLTITWTPMYNHNAQISTLEGLVGITNGTIGVTYLRRSDNVKSSDGTNSPEVRFLWYIKRLYKIAITWSVKNNYYTIGVLYEGLWDWAAPEAFDGDFAIEDYLNFGYTISKASNISDFEVYDKAFTIDEMEELF